MMLSLHLIKNFNKKVLSFILIIKSYKLLILKLFKINKNKIVKRDKGRLIRKSYNIKNFISLF